MIQLILHSNVFIII